MKKITYKIKNDTDAKSSISNKTSNNKKLIDSISTYAVLILIVVIIFYL